MTTAAVRLLPMATLLVFMSLDGHAAQIGGGTCTNATVSGTYFYVPNGSILSGGQVVPYAELGRIVADGQGGVSGQSFGSLNGQQATFLWPEDIPSRRRSLVCLGRRVRSPTRGSLARFQAGIRERGK